MAIQIRRLDTASPDFPAALDALVRWDAGPAGAVASGVPVSNTDSADGGFGVLSLLAGDYRVTVVGDGATTGDYRFRLLDLANATPIVLGNPVSSTLSPLTETDLYQFNIAGGERLFFDMTSASGMANARWQLRDPFLNGVFEGGFSSSASHDVGPLTLTRPGTYTLMAEGRVFDSGAGSYSFVVTQQGTDPVPPRAAVPAAPRPWASRLAHGWALHSW